MTSAELPRPPQKGSSHWPRVRMIHTKTKIVTADTRSRTGKGLRDAAHGI
jgi:hypothetical protein